jgi:hypothetical protein
MTLKAAAEKVQSKSQNLSLEQHLVEPQSIQDGT